MLIIFVFFSVASASLVAAFAVAVVNVVVRRECAYLIEEKLNAMVENQRLYTQLITSDRTCSATELTPIAFGRSADIVWPGTYTSLVPISRQRADGLRPDWVNEDSFTGTIVDRGHLVVRSLEKSSEGKCAGILLADTALDFNTVRALSQAAGLEISDDLPIALRSFRKQEGMRGEIAANFIPGSKRAVPVVITARNWETGKPEDWVICTVRLSYARTAADLSHMGLMPASWLAPLGGLAASIITVYVCGLILSARLSQQIVATIDGLSDAAQRVGKGDFSVKVAVVGQDQLSLLASSFNGMTEDLRSLRQQEKQAALLEWDVTLAREIQEHLFPQPAAPFAGINVAGVNHPARFVSGDLHAMFRLSDFEVGILCADLSGKGVSAALMMAHMQGLLHGRLLVPNENNSRPSPAAFIEALNRDLHGRFGNSRYATLFYGEYDCRTGVMRYINAGHCPPILVSRSHEVSAFSQGDLPVGLFPETRYQEFEISLAAGSSILIYTDGVTDALNSNGEAFGESRLLASCRQLHPDAEARAIVESTADRVIEWSAGVERTDDITIVALTIE